jgi:HD-GYP domain-containing protein (c-di-GMP phosphodiesterase class II)
MSWNTHPNEGFLGKRLKQDIFNEAGILVASAFVVLNHAQLKILESHHIVLEQRNVETVPAISANSDFEKNTLINESVLQMEEIFHSIQRTRKIPLLDIRRQIIPIIHQTAEQKYLFRLFTSLQSKDDYTYRHNIAVGVIATLIGKWIGLTEAELSQLSMAATLHDVGKIKIPLEILNKPGELTKDEYKLMKKHTIYGYEMIKETVGTNHRQALVALQHHERQDGRGYPFGIRADKIDYFSRIVAVADVFHAMISKRAYRNASPFYETLKQMKQNAFGDLDPRIVSLFLDKIMQSLIGNDVLLTDGRKGTIVMINRVDPIHPLVRIGDLFLDLSKEPALQIEQVIA